MSLSLYRCAVCGSPNVVTDTQTAGVGYDYGKGLFGTLLFGSGGAVAGVRSKQQKVFKCPDCGQTLTYPMDEETKQVIDIGVMYADARSDLRLRGVRVSWDSLKSKYRNIESGFADQTIATRREAGKELLQSYETATKEEFDEAVDTIISFRGRMGESLYSEAIDEEYSQRNMPKLSEYRAYCNAVDLFIENTFKFFSAEELKSCYYNRGNWRYALRNVFKDSIAPYLFRKYVSDHGEMKRSAIDSFPNRMPGNSFNLIDYVVSEPFIWEIIATWSDTPLGIDLKDFRKRSYEDSEELNRKFLRDYFGTGHGRFFSRLTYDTVIPLLIEEDGVLYWWDGPDTCFNELSEAEKAYYEDNKIYPSWIIRGSKDRIVDTYFKHYPEKKAEFERDIKEIENKSTTLFPASSQITLLAKKYDYFTVWHPIEE